MDCGQFQSGGMGVALFEEFLVRFTYVISSTQCLFDVLQHLQGRSALLSCTDNYHHRHMNTTDRFGGYMDNRSTSLLDLTDPVSTLPNQLSDLVFGKWVGGGCEICGKIRL